MTTMNLTNCLMRRTIYNPSEIGKMLHNHLDGAEIIKTGKKESVYNIPASFDIETTSYYDDTKEKRACMYEWTLGINGGVMIGRTWQEFTDVMQTISSRTGTTTLRIYVHNLAFEFQFLRRWFDWKTVFAVSDRKPVKAITETNIEFRCSLILSGYSLAKLGENLQRYKVQKMVGDLDYSLKRHSFTPLTDAEIGYCVNDVMVVMAYIQECIENDGNIDRIPLTNTGYVRKYCRDACMYDGSHKHKTWKFIQYRQLMDRLQMSPDEYAQLKRAFQGGFTHANAEWVRKTLNDLRSYDFTSSYPTTMVADKFPMSAGETYKPKSMQDFLHQLTCYCCLFDVEFIEIESCVTWEHPISYSHCRQVQGEILDNGRVVYADHLITTITEQDFYIYEKYYKWKSIRIGTFRRYKRGYLPTPLVKSILDLYQKKTTLKGVSGAEVEYMRSKGMLNSVYGMCVTDMCKDESVYKDGEWHTEPVDLIKAIEKENKSVKRFLFYPWGIWVTAYARRNLFLGITECRDDYVYADTDSIKMLHPERHVAFIEKYNRLITSKLEKACDYHGFDYSMIRPLTIKGKPAPMGVYDDEGSMQKFKTLGAKRYLYLKDDELHLTVSGVNKKNAVPYMVAKFGPQGAFDAFNDNLVIPRANDLDEPIFDASGIEIENPCGKMCHTYVDDEYDGMLTDYTGTAAPVHELSFVHLENVEYSLSLSDEFILYLSGVKEVKLL